MDKKPTVMSTILIDIGAESVAGAYVLYRQNKAPDMLYTQRVPIQMRADESPEKAMLATLSAIGSDLVREGAPVLMRVLGRGNADAIIVSIDTPWLETTIHIEKFERDRPFVFTKTMADAAVRAARKHAADGKLLADEKIIGAIANGYETSDPYGKHAQNLSFIILHARINEPLADDIAAILRSAFHTKQISSISETSLRYQAIRAAFPHEQNMLILAATAHTASIALVRKGFCVASADVPAVNNGQTWSGAVSNALRNLAARYPLPRTIFFLSDEERLATMKRTLQDEEFKGLWLADTPPKIISLQVSHFSQWIRYGAAVPLDLPLSLSAFVCEQHIHWG